MHKRSTTLVPLALMLVSAGCMPMLEDSGVLVAGEQCTLFRADYGGDFILADYGEFQPGDRVRVTGLVDTTCQVSCAETLGCVRMNTISASEPAFAQCGEIIHGTICDLFAADDGGVYRLDDYGDFAVGDRVRVAGTLVTDCINPCEQDEGCIVNNTIASCD
jgi:hypothetical protein